MLGVGLQNTLLGVRAGLENFSNYATGALMACYFLGFISGSILCPKLIERVGHIRVFAALASLTSCVFILHPVTVDPWIWSIYRMLTGFSVAGLYLVVESWLNGRVTNRIRGAVLSAYFFVNLGAVAMGQLLLQLDQPQNFELFIYASVLVSLAVLPVGVTRAEAPAPTRAPTLQWSALLSISPYALFGAVAAGLANGAFWGLAPLYGVRIGADSETISVLMSAVILGGAALQLPLGWLSDLVDRRLVMAGANAALAAVCAAAMLTAPSLSTFGLLAAAAFGGLLLTQYALCVTHANDYVADGDYVQLASALLLVFGGSAAAGPIVGAALMTLVAPNALFLLIGGASGASALYAVWRMSRRSAPPAEAAPEAATAPILAAAPAGISATVLPPNEDALDGIDEDVELEAIEFDAEPELAPEQEDTPPQGGAHSSASGPRPPVDGTLEVATASQNTKTGD